MRGCRSVTSELATAVMLAYLTLSGILTAACATSDPMKLVALADKGDLAAFQGEMSKGFDPGMWNTEAGSLADTPLHAAARSGSVPIVKLLLDRGVDPQLRTRDGMTPLAEALVAESVGVVSELAQRGIDLNQPMQGNLTPLAVAISTGREELVATILDHGANVNQVSGDPEHTPLSMAVVGGRVALVKLLLDRGAIAAPGVNTALPPLHAAVLSADPNPEIVGLLLRHGAVADDFAIQTARDQHGKELATLLLASVANPVIQRTLRDVYCKECPIPKNELVDLIVKFEEQQKRK